MSEISQEVPVTVIDEAHFEKYPDAALLLKCFEVVKDALDVIDEPEYSIEKEDDTHIDLYRAYYALKVLFRRRTGHDARQVAQDRIEAMSRHLLEGGPRPQQLISVVRFPGDCLPDDAFDDLTDQQLACTAFNNSNRVRTLIMDNSLTALAIDEARMLSIDAENALRVLVLRMSGGSVEAMGTGLCRKPWETLQ